MAFPPLSQKNRLSRPVVRREYSEHEQRCDKAGCGVCIPAGKPSIAWEVNGVPRRRCLKHYPSCTELPGYALPTKRGADGLVIQGY
jgi:hypothetical protein